MTRFLRPRSYMWNFVARPASKSMCLVLLAQQVSPQPPFAKGGCLSCSVRGNSDRLGRRHTTCRRATHFSLYTSTGKTAWDGEQCRSQTQQLLLKIIALIEPHNFKSKTMCPTNSPSYECIISIYYLICIINIVIN